MGSFLVWLNSFNFPPNTDWDCRQDLQVTGWVCSVDDCCSIAVWIAAVSPLSSDGGGGFGCVVGSGSVVWVGFLACVGAAGGTVGHLAGASSGWFLLFSAVWLLMHLWRLFFHRLLSLREWWNLWFLWWCIHCIYDLKGVSAFLFFYLLTTTVSPILSLCCLDWCHLSWLFFPFISVSDFTVLWWLLCRVIFQLCSDLSVHQELVGCGLGSWVWCGSVCL